MLRVNYWYIETFVFVKTKQELLFVMKSAVKSIHCNSIYGKDPMFSSKKVNKNRGNQDQTAP